MKRISILTFTVLGMMHAYTQNTPVPITDSFYQLSPIEVKGVRAGGKAPFAKTNIGKDEITRRNQGQDIPFLLNHTPSVVINSDAGNGVGYTGMRIRGSDATRINITLNGIPYNDAESHGSFFVNMPDFLSSVNSIQIQRGAGTSSNGTGAFGATVSLSTNTLNKEAYTELNNTFGSFNTWKNTIKFGSGLINEKFTFDARLSRVSSDGYIDRASSNLQSFYLSGAYLLNKSTFRINVFSGKEKTYQAWNGISEEMLKENRRYNPSGTEKPGAPYDNETDNYQQTHYQLFYDTRFNDNWSFNTAAFLTRGKGYYDNYKGGQRLSNYGRPNIIIDGELKEKTDLTRQKHLDNYFYGQIVSLHYNKNKHSLTFGGGWNNYNGDHFGLVTWAEYGFPQGYEYYRNDARKTDLNAYAKWQYQLSSRLSLFTDIQYRNVRHKMNGFSDNPGLFVNRKFRFVNPKAGLTYIHNNWQAYISYANAKKEPNRDDFEAAVNEQPKYENLHDFEAAVERRTDKYFVSAGLFYMLYKNQLVLTGMLNEVGATTRMNVPNSYRAGIELQGSYIFNKWLHANANLTLSRNKIKEYTGFADDWDTEQQFSQKYTNTDISFSPAVTGFAELTFIPANNISVGFSGKYVSKQYLDNTQNTARSIKEFFTNDLTFIYTLKDKLFKEWMIVGRAINIFDVKYAPNGWTYGYRSGGIVTQDNGYYPMAGINFSLGLNINL